MGGGCNRWWWWEGDAREDDRTWRGEGHIKKIGEKLVKCRQKQGWQKKRVRKTMHFSGRYVPQCVFETAGQYYRWGKWCNGRGWFLGDVREDDRRWRTQGWCKRKSRRSRRFWRFQDWHSHDLCEDRDRKTMWHFYRTVSKNFFKRAGPSWYPFS